MLKLPYPIAVVCNDAGATNIIIEWIKANGTSNLKVLMRGPARLLWENAFPHFPICNSLEEVLNGAKTLLSGTGWSSEVEHESRVIASNKNIHSIAVIDHWVNYELRFTRNNRVQLPDQIWVTDNYAFTLAENQFKNSKVVLKKNLYFENQLRNISPAPESGSILILLEPVRCTWGKSVDGEFQVLDYVYSNLSSLCEFEVKKVIIRPHPSDPAQKYNEWIMSHKLVELDTSENVCTAISAADLVIGIESFALTIALASGRPVFSGLPPWAPKLRLPHKGIKQIRNILHQNEIICRT